MCSAAAAVAPAVAPLNRLLQQAACAPCTTVVVGNHLLTPQKQQPCHGGQVELSSSAALEQLPA
jgi:hypothetical protein